MGRVSLCYRPAILHCHGNATDLGFMLPSYVDLAENLNVEVFALEYSGYGPPEYHEKKIKCGTRTVQRAVVPSFREITSDAESAYWHLVNEQRIKPERIVFYGQSVGSGRKFCDLEPILWREGAYRGCVEFRSLSGAFDTRRSGMFR